MAQSRPLNPFLLSLFIILIMLTLVLTILFFVKNGRVKDLVEGNNETGIKSLASVQQEVDALRQKVRSTENEIAARQEVSYQVALELSKRRVHFDGANQITDNAGGTMAAGHKGKESHWQVLRDQVTEVKKRLDSLLAEHESPDRQSFPPLDAAIQKRQAEMQAVLALAKEKDDRFKDDMDRVAKQKEALEKEKLKAEKQKRADYSRLQTARGQKEDQIRSLLELELHWFRDKPSNVPGIVDDRYEADGEILEVLKEEEQVIINLGRADNVFPGLLFEVFQDDKGRHIEKGMLEAVDVRPRITICRLLREADSRRQPLAKGDKVGNPVFDGKNPRIFVLTGEFKHYNQEDLEGFLRATGALVRDKLGPGVHYLVAGERSEKQQDAAREYPVMAMTEDRLLRYVQTTFATRAPGARPPIRKPAAPAAGAPAPAAAAAAPAP